MIREQNLAQSVIAVREIIPVKKAIEYLERMLNQGERIQDIIREETIFEIIVRRNNLRFTVGETVTLSDIGSNGLLYAFVAG